MRRSLAITAVIALASAPSAAAGVPKDFVGIDSQDTFQHAFNNNVNGVTSNLSAQAAIGIQLHRQPFNWETIESQPGVYDLTVTDRYMLSMASHGMRVLPILFDAPPWHSAAGEQLDKGIYARPTSGKALGKFGAALIRRYGPAGTFWEGMPATYRTNSAIRAWQIWNEPNLRYYWGDRPNAKQYVRLLKGASRQMKAVDPKAEIVTAGIPQSTTRRAIPLDRYITKMYRAGAKKWFDTFGLNAYAKNAKDLGRKLALVRGLMDKARDRKARIWITEIGWADTGNPHYLVKGPRGQALQITKSIRLIREQRKSRRIRGFVYYLWRDALPYREGIDAGTWGFHAGLLRQDGSFKLAHRAFKRAVAKL